MKEKTGEIYSVARDNPPVPGCTISREIRGGENSITYFSLAEDTDISAETHPYGMLLLVAEGTLEVYRPDSGGVLEVSAGGSVFLAPGETAGMRTRTGAVYTEITIGRNDEMNKAVKAGEVFRLADLVPYADGRIVNMDLLHNDKMKFVVMAFDAGTGLSEHAAPGEALVFALEGEGVIRYEGVEHTIHAGESFHFAKGGMHAVKAGKKFKMGLLVTLD